MIKSLLKKFTEKNYKTILVNILEDPNIKKNAL
jgi:hypothetical protein